MITEAVIIGECAEIQLRLQKIKTIQTNQSHKKIMEFITQPMRPIVGAIIYSQFFTGNNTKLRDHVF